LLAIDVGTDNWFGEFVKDDRLDQSLLGDGGNEFVLHVGCVHFVVRTNAVDDKYLGKLGSVVGN